MKLLKLVFAIAFLIIGSCSIKAQSPPNPETKLEKAVSYGELKLELYKGDYTAVFYTGEKTKLTDDKNKLLKRKDEVLASPDPMVILNFLAYQGWKVHSFFLDENDKRYYLLYK